MEKNKKLEFDSQNCLTGKVTLPIVDGKMKAKALEWISMKEKIPIEQTIAVGDGANDLLLLKKAKIGVAFHAKKILKEQTKHHLNENPIFMLAFLLNLKNIPTLNENFFEDLLFEKVFIPQFMLKEKYTLQLSQFLLQNNFLIE